MILGTAETKAFALLWGNSRDEGVFFFFFFYMVVKK